MSILLPKRRKPTKMGCNMPKQIRSAAHLKWIRGHECAAANPDCQGPIEAAHVRIGTDGGTSIKPSDCWAVPLCSWHHRLQHQIGERSFENGLNLDLLEIAKALWAKSPHRLRATAARDAREMRDG